METSSSASPPPVQTLEENVDKTTNKLDTLVRVASEVQRQKSDNESVVENTSVTEQQEMAEEKDRTNKEIVSNDHESVKDTDMTEQQQRKTHKKTVSNVTEEKDTANKEIVSNDHEAVNDTSMTEQQQLKAQKDVQKDTSNKEIVSNNHEAVKDTSMTEQQQHKTQKDVQKLLNISKKIYFQSRAHGLVQARNNHTSRGSLMTNITCHTQMKFNPQLVMNQIEIVKPKSSHGFDKHPDKTVPVKVLQPSEDPSNTPQTWSEKINGTCMIFF